MEGYWTSCFQDLSSHSGCLVLCPQLFPSICRMDFGSQVHRFFQSAYILQNTPVGWLKIITELALVKHINIRLNYQVFCFSIFIFLIPCNVWQLTVLYFSILKYPISFGFHDPSLCCSFYLFNISFFSTHCSYASCAQKYGYYQEYVYDLLLIFLFILLKILFTSILSITTMSYCLWWWQLSFQLLGSFFF